MTAQMVLSHGMPLNNTGHVTSTLTQQEQREQAKEQWPSHFSRNFSELTSVDHLPARLCRSHLGGPKVAIFADNDLAEYP